MPNPLPEGHERVIVVGRLEQHRHESTIGDKRST